jgi:hypothetical protein
VRGGLSVVWMIVMVGCWLLGATTGVGMDLADLSLCAPRLVVGVDG